MYTSRGDLLNIFWNELINFIIKKNQHHHQMYFPPVNQFYISGYVFVSWYILREKIMWYMYKCCGQTNLRKMSSLYWTSLAPCSRSREVRGLSVPPWTNKRAVINGPCCSPRPSPEFIKLPSGVDRDQLLNTLSHSQTSRSKCLLYDKRLDQGNSFFNLHNN